MELFTLFLINAALFVAAELLRPKPEIEDAEATPFEEAAFPSVDPTKKIPIVLGRDTIRSPHVADVTEYNTVPITNKVKTGLFSSQRVTVGYRYFVGMQLMICVGPVTLRKIYWDDDEIWSGTAAANPNGVAIDIDLPDYLGGREEGGGLVGRITFFAGTATQNQSSYLAGFQSEGIAYRHTAMIVLENFEVGEQPNIQPMAFEVENYVNPLGLAAGTNLIGDDLNPMSIAAEVFTNDDWGFSEPISSVQAFDAVAATLDTEGNGMSIKLVKETRLDKLLKQIGKQVDGQHRYRPDLTAWDYKLFRDDYTVGSLPHYGDTEGNVIKYSNFKRVNWDELNNLIEVVFSDRTTKTKPSPAIAHDRSLYDRLGGRNNPVTLRFPGVHDRTLANKLANRALRKGAFPFSAVDILVDRNAYNLLPGDVIKWSESTLGIDQLVMRVMKISLGTPDQSEIRISLVEDVFAQSSALFSNPPNSSYVPNSSAPINTTVGIFEDQPYYLAQFDEDRSAVEGVEKLLSAAESPQNNSLYYEVESRAGVPGTDPYIVGEQVPYTPSGTLQDGLDVTEANIDEVTTLVVEGVSNSALLDDELAAVTDEEIKAGGRHFILIEHATEEHEIVAYDSASRAGSTITLNNVHRGMIDTLPQDHPIGARVWFLNAAMGTLPDEYTASEDIDFRYFTVATTGRAASGLAGTIVFRNRTARPYLPGKFEINGLRLPTSTFAEDTAFNFEWRHRDKETGRAQFSGDTTQDAAATDLESGFEYRLRIYDDDTNTLLRTRQGTGTGAGEFTTYSTTTVTYDYPLVDQQADGGPFSTYRVELDVIDTATGTVESLLDIIRVFTVLVPINLLKRGEIYQAHNDQGTATAYFPMAEESGAMADVMGSSPNMTSVGANVGYRSAGPAGNDYSVFIPAELNHYLTIADDATNDMDGNVGIGFWFRCGPTDGVNDTALVYKGSVTDASSANTWRIYIDILGRLRWQWNTGTRNASVWDSKRVDDGHWHYVFCFCDNPGYMILDGQVEKSGGAGATFFGASADPIVIGGHNDSTSAGLADIEIAHLSFWDDVGLMGSPNYSGGSLTNAGAKNFAEFLARVMGAHRRIKEPHYAAMMALKPSAYWEFGDYGALTISSNARAPLIDLTGNNCMSNGWNASSWSPTAPSNTLTMQDTNVALTGQYNRVNEFDATEGIQVGSFTNTGASPEGSPIGLADVFAGDCETFSSAAWVKIRTGHSTRLFLWGAGDFSSMQNSWGFGVDANGCPYTWATDNYLSTSYRLVTSDDAIPENEWVHIAFSKTDDTDAVFFINGKQVSGETVSFNSAEWDVVGRWAKGSRESTGSQVMFLAGSNGTEAGDSSPFKTWDGWIHGIAIWIGEQVPNEDWAGLFAAGRSPNYSMLEMLARDNPAHLYPLESSTDAADLFDNSGDGQPTATGTFRTDTLAIEGDVKAGHTTGVLTPVGFDANEQLEYATEILGNADLEDFTAGVIMRPKDNGGTVEVIFRNSDTTDDTNLSFQRIATTHEGQFDIFEPSGGSITTLDPFEPGVPGLFAYREEAGGNRSLWRNQSVNISDGSAEDYTGSTQDRFFIGDRFSDDLGFNGEIAYVFAFDRVVSAPIIRRMFAKMRGHSDAQVAILQHGAQILFTLDDDPGITTTHINAALDVSQDATAAGTVTQSSAGGLWRAQKMISMLSANSAQITGAADADLTSFPFTVGGLFRVDVADGDAFVSFSNSGANDDYFKIGIFDSAAGIVFGNAGGEVSRTTGAITDGDVAFVCVVCNSASNKEVYINGELVLSDTNNDALDFPSTIDSFGINAVVESSGTTRGNGSYSHIFAVESALTDAQVMEIYADLRQDLLVAHMVNSGADMIYRLDEYIDAQLTFHDMLDRSQKGTGTGITQGVTGLINSRKSLCVDFDGTGEIDLARTDYPNGGTNRVIEFVVEAGFLGTVCSMGDDTDAEAFVVAIDSSGDVRVHIRGSGNERIFTAAIDTGTEHHVAVELNGTLLTDVNCYVNGALASVGTAGSGTTLLAGSTENLTLGSVGNLTTLGGAPYIDATGKLQHFAVYSAEWGATTTDSAAIADYHHEALS